MFDLYYCVKFYYKKKQLYQFLALKLTFLLTKAKRKYSIKNDIRLANQSKTIDCELRLPHFLPIAWYHPVLHLAQSKRLEQMVKE